MIQRYLRTLDAVRRSYPEAKRLEEAGGDFPSAILYRPVSNWLTPLFLMAGWPADAVSALGIGLSLAMVGIAAWLGAHAWPEVVSIGLAVQILDCADGSVARTSGRPSRIGRMLESVGSLLGWTCYFVTVGMLAQSEVRTVGGFGPHGREIGLGLAVLYLAQRAIEDRFDDYVGERISWDPLSGVARKVNNPAGGPARNVNWARYGRLAKQALAFGGLAFCGLCGRIPWFLAGLAAYQLILLGWWLARFVLRALACR